MSYQVFQNGTALTAEVMNDVIMEQAVPTFTNASERDNAIPAPNAGQHCHLLSTNTTYYYNSGLVALSIDRDTGWGTVTLDSFWKPLPNGAEQTRLRTKNGVLYFSIAANPVTGMWSVGQRLFTLPTGSRPTTNMWFMGDWAGVMNEVKFATDGNVVMGTTTAGSGIVCSGSFPIN